MTRTAYEKQSDRGGSVPQPKTQPSYRDEPGTYDMIGAATRLAQVADRGVTALEQRMQVLEGRATGNEPGSTWKSFGEFLGAVRSVGRDGGRVTDQRLIESRAASGLTGGEAPDAGSFILPAEFSNALMEMVRYAAPIASRALRIPATRRSISMPAIDETSRANGSRWGGVTSSWTDEGAQITGTKPKFRRLGLNLNKLTSLIYATDELSEDASALGTFVANAFTAEAAFQLDDMLVNGTGSGQPLGMLNAPGLIVQAKESGQSAGTLVPLNLANMFARMLPECRARAVFLVSPEVEETLYTGGFSNADGTWNGLHEFGEKVSEIALEGLALAGISTGLMEIGKEALEVAANVEKASVSITALTGSAQTANAVIEDMEKLAMSNALAFPEILHGAQGFIAIGIEAEKLTYIMQSVADAAKATDHDFEGVESRFQNIVLSGKLSARTMNELGLSIADVSRVMGVQAEEAAKLFGALDQVDRAAILAAAGQAKFGGLGEKSASTLLGAWTEFKNEFEHLMIQVGNAISPVAEAMLGFAGRVTQALSEIGGLMGALAEIVQLQGEINPIRNQRGATQMPKHAQGATAQSQSGATADPYAGAANLAQKDSLSLDVDLAAALENLHKVQADVAASTGLLETAFTKANDALDAVNQRFHLHLATSGEVRIATENVTKAFQEMHPEFENVRDAAARAAIQFSVLREAQLPFERSEAAAVSFDLFTDALKRGSMEAPELTEHLQNLNAATQMLQGVIQKSSAPMDKITEDFKALGLTIDDVTGKIGQRAVMAFEDLNAKGMLSAENVETAWAGASRAIDKLAKTDLPTAIKAYDEYIAALQRVGAPLGDIYAAQEKELQMEIAINQQRGTGSSKQIIDLTNLQLKTQALANSGTYLGQMYKGLAVNFTHAFQALGSGIAQSIVHMKSLGQIWTNIAQSIAQSILQTVIGAGIQKLADALIGLLPQFAKIVAAQGAAGIAAAVMASAVDKLQIVGAAAVGGANAAAATAAIPIFGPALALQAGWALDKSIMSTFLPQASFDKGGYVPSDMLARVHKGEYVTTAAKVAAGNYGPSGTGGVSFHGCTFSGVTQQLVNDMFNKATKQIRRVGGKI